jgi:hypothetical protein
MDFLTESRLNDNNFKHIEEKHNDLITFNFGFSYFNLKIKNDFIKEIELGVDDKFNFEYYHHWHDHQIHCISLGFFYFYWKGEPLFDRKR